MNETWDPTDVPAATRGEFLAARETAVRELERRIGSPLALLQNNAPVLGAVVAVTMAGSALSDVRVETFHVVFAVVLITVALATVPFTVRRALVTRQLMSAVLAWETAERQARNLPPGLVRPDLRMPFDARQDADFEDVAHVSELQAEFRPTARWLSLKAALPAVGSALGIALVLGGPITEPVAQGVTFFVSGAYMLICCLVSVVGTFRTSWRLREVWKVHRAEIHAWRSERIGPVAAAEVDRARRRQRWFLAAPFIVTPVVAFVVGGTMSSSAAVPVAMGVVLLAGLVIDVVALALERRRRAPVSSEHHITSVPPG